MINQYKIPIALSMLGLVLIIGGVFASGLTKQKPKEYPKDSLVTADKIISVDVSGAVKKAGVYKLKDGARIEEAIEMAGGFTEEANQEFISKYLNLAQKLSDGSKVYVPAEGEQVNGVQTAQTGGPGQQGKVNINTASQPELEALPQIATDRASKIISNRPYQSVDELVSKKVITKGIFDKIKDLVVVY
ncbi:helix-hairpin-helix domain-containing protein [Candidatus Daviesbacteria bacterium]|nr:helix-hairpin-helix domain-containing protein [Candidatus Daviesbacteria bacterium]